MPLPLAELFFIVPSALHFFSAQDAYNLGRLLDPLIDSSINVHSKLHGFRMVGNMLPPIAGRFGQRGFENSIYPEFSRFFHPCEIVHDEATGGYFVSDTGNSAIRKISRNGAVSTLAGGVRGGMSSDGIGSFARFHSPHGLSLDNKGRKLYVSDTDSHTIRCVSLVSRMVETIAGQPGKRGSTCGKGKSSLFSSPHGLALCTSTSRLYVADSMNGTIRCLDLELGEVSTLRLDFGCLNPPRLFHPRGLALRGANELYVCDMGNHRIVKVCLQKSVVCLVAGGMARGPHGEIVPALRDGPSHSALFNHPYGVSLCPSKRQLFVVDFSSHALRVVDLYSKTVSTLFSRPSLFSGPSPFSLDFPQGLCHAWDGGVLICDTVSNCIRRVL